MIQIRIRTFLLLSILACITCAVVPLAAQESDPFQPLRNKDLKGALEALGEIHDAGHFWSRDRGDAVPAFVGGVARLLAQEDDEVQYELLYQWTMPADDRNGIRILTSPVPRAAPPEVFARVLRERPRETSFQVSEINGVRGLFSTGWKLVTLAGELGRLDRLTNELEELNQQGVPDADVLLLLAKLADRRPDVEFVRRELPKVVERVSQTGPAELSPDDVVHPTVLALGAAALKHDESAPSGESILSSLVDQANRLAAYRMRSFLRASHAVAVQRVQGMVGAGFLYENPLQDWVPVSADTARTSAEGTASPMWFSHEGHIVHLAGSQNDLLFFRYPLRGDFEFAAEVQATSGHVTDCSLIYGGLFFQALGRNRTTTVWDANMSVIREKPCPFAREETDRTFNRVAINSRTDGANYSVNRHPMWFDDEEIATSPFVGFRCYGNHPSAVRNIELTGNPVIPREVVLSSGTQLRGWESRFFGETKRSAHSNVGPYAAFDWFMDDGEIHAAIRENATARQSLLRYQRPLLEDETVRYEFYYVPGETEVHPALGRLAFLIEPRGVRIHWITDGEREWTGLPEDNATLEPLNRRGPRQLPLNQEGWNAVELSRSENKLELSLNGERIYERPLDFSGNTNFGLFRDPSRTSVRVRNVILTGDWPETIPEEFLQNPAAVADDAERQEHQLTLHALADPEIVAANLNAVRRRAAALPLAERYEFLRSWVLPSETHSDIRMLGEFTPTDPSPLALELEPFRFRNKQGSELVSPVYDLLNAAAELGRLAELSARVEALPTSSDLGQQRAQRSLQIMIALEQQDRERALELADQLQLLLHESFRVKEREYWPELHLITRAMRRHSADEVIAGLITDLYQQRFSFGIRVIDKSHLVALMREYQAKLYGLPAPCGDSSAGLKNWIPVTRAISELRGAGSPNLCWTFDSEGLLTIGSGHHEDYLFYRSPLVGNYEVHVTMSRIGSSAIMTGGRFAGSSGDGTETLVGTFRYPDETTDIVYPFQRNDQSVYYRAKVGQRRVRALLNGQLIFEHRPDDPLDQWVALRGISTSSTAFHRVRIDGNPAIPDEIPMTTADDLSCWIPYYLGTKEFTWNRLEDESGQRIIQSGRRPDLAGSHFEGLLRYHRPLVEDGSIEYEFYYSPGRCLAHPALDRLVFLLDPSGVKIHWLTDEKHDFTAVPPGNAIDEPGSRRGPETLPLKPDEWNRMKLSIARQTASLELNGTLIYERELEETNRRTFGLFHYADRNELLVRNPVMRAEWPKTLPSLYDQELADSALTVVDRNLEKLKKSFYHDFAKDGYPEAYFTTGPSGVTPQFDIDADGVRVTMTGRDGWHAFPMIARFGLQGDFDVQAEIAELDLEEAGSVGSAFLDLKLDDERQHYLRTMRRWNENEKHNICAQISPLLPNGKRTWPSQFVAEAAPSGTLRMSRIGDRIYFSFAEEDSQVFRVFHDELISDGDVLMNGVELKTGLRDGGRVSALWKNVTIRAERMTYLPPYDRTELNQLWVMDADGTNVRKLMGLLPEMTNMGSPEFSRDGKQIALDMSQGSVANSHIIVLNADGTNVRDLGPGCMPSFSPDGERMAFTQSGSGIMLMAADGTNREAVDRAGWGVQYSPDGKFIAYGKSGNITLLNLETKETRELLKGPDAARYNYTYWNLGWSHDSNSIAFKGRLSEGGGTEVAVVDINDGSLTVLDPDASRVNPDFTFSPDNQGVLFSKRGPGNFRPQLYLVHRKSPGELELLKGQPEDRTLDSCDWSHDGQLITFTGQLDPQPVEWKPLAEKRLPSAADR